MLGIDESADAALALGFGDDVIDERRLAGGLGAEDLAHAAARQTADAECEVEAETAGRDRCDRYAIIVTQAHDCTLAVLLLDLCQRCADSLLFLAHGDLLPAVPEWDECVNSVHQVWPPTRTLCCA